MSKGAKGLKQDPADGLEALAGCRRQGPCSGDERPGPGVSDREGRTADPAKAAEWYRKAAELKLADAENNLGMLYLEGKGVTRDLAQAFRLFERAAAQNDPWGLNNLGGMYEMGWGHHRRQGKALELYRRRCAKGNIAAQKNIDRLSVADDSAG